MNCTCVCVQKGVSKHRRRRGDCKAGTLPTLYFFYFLLILGMQIFVKNCSDNLPVTFIHRAENKINDALRFVRSARSTHLKPHNRREKKKQYISFSLYRLSAILELYDLH